MRFIKNIGTCQMNAIRFLFAFLCLITTGCGKSNTFTKTFDKPSWFNSIEAPTLNTVDEVSALWQSEERCCVDPELLLKNNRVFYKSCYNAIANNHNDEPLVVTCLWLMNVGADSKQSIELSRFLLDNFSHHKNRVDNCANCMPADTVARVTLEVATFDSRISNSKKAPIDSIERLLDSRSDEISYWVQAEIYEFLGNMYLEEGVTQERLERFAKAYTKLNQVKDYNEPLAKRFESIEKRYRLLLNPPPKIIRNSDSGVKPKIE
jgi:hypothetical protein